MKKILASLFLVILTGCVNESEVVCTCASFAIKLNSTIDLDSVKYQNNNEEKIILGNNVFFGSKEGEYKLIAYKSGYISDTSVFQVKFNGNVRCKTLETVEISYTIESGKLLLSKNQSSSSCNGS